MEDEEFEVEFIFDKKAHPIKKLWDETKFRSVLYWYIIKGWFMYFITMGGVEIEVGYEEDGEMINYLYLEKLW